jgi:hypothetical protein
MQTEETWLCEERTGSTRSFVTHVYAASDGVLARKSSNEERVEPTQDTLNTIVELCLATSQYSNALEVPFWPQADWDQGPERLLTHQFLGIRGRFGTLPS